MKYELQDIICGTGKVSYGDTIKAAASYLRGSQSASRMAQKDKPHKREETESLCKWIEADKPYLEKSNYAATNCKSSLTTKHNKYYR